MTANDALASSRRGVSSRPRLIHICCNVSDTTWTTVSILPLMIKHFQIRSVREDHRLEVNASMADEARLASALTGVTERLDAHDDAHEADDDGVSLTRSEGTKQYYIHTCSISKLNVLVIVF